MFVSSSMPSLSILAYNKPMNITMQRLTHATACLPLVFHFLFYEITWGKSGISYDVPRTSPRTIEERKLKVNTMVQ